jgi:hypothetical protein
MSYAINTTQSADLTWLRQMWGRLTARELQRYECNREGFFASICEKYGLNQAEAEHCMFDLKGTHPFRP